VHEVAVAEFWLGRTEVTNAQFRRFRKDHRGDDKLPAVNVSWDDARRSARATATACRARPNGNTPRVRGARRAIHSVTTTGNLDGHAWYTQNSGGEAHPVAGKDPNRWGLYDMHGNVLEWVQDCYHDSYRGAPADGSAWEEGSCENRVLRGGSFDDSAEFLRSAGRFRERGRGQGTRALASAVCAARAASLDACFLTFRPRAAGSHAEDDTLSPI
jgi:formylglycine-generating enzyme required for sulfatase activity